MHGANSTIHGTSEMSDCELLQVGVDVRCCNVEAGMLPDFAQKAGKLSVSKSNTGKMSNMS